MDTAGRRSAPARQSWTNRQAIEADQVPRSLIVLGGGAAGVELAQVFARFGTAVTMIEALDRLLAQDEPESSELITKIFRREGITVHGAVIAVGVAYVLRGPGQGPGG